MVHFLLIIAVCHLEIRGAEMPAAPRAARNITEQSCFQGARITQTTLQTRPQGAWAMLAVSVLLLLLLLSKPARTLRGNWLLIVSSKLNTTKEALHHSVHWFTPPESSSQYLLYVCPNISYCRITALQQLVVNVKITQWDCQKLCYYDSFFFFLQNKRLKLNHNRRVQERLLWMVLNSQVSSLIKSHQKKDLWELCLLLFLCLFAVKISLYYFLFGWEEIIMIKKIMVKKYSIFSSFQS